ncbi:hypothetical protein [Nocardioides sp. B-3]|uniref:hypothetical protein n=1 Tax=Nocardioides sp. B-3 TaxID=2895565 RepID=UPI002152930D|nr:hypothetical protein [Nocardioides sp. B-3]UUZ60797.1 hypothetical protein LP418_08610 [Nocardioides sp. B-3]
MTKTLAAVVAAISVLVAPLTTGLASATVSAAVVDVKFGDAIEVPEVAPFVGRIKLRLHGRKGEGFVLANRDASADCERAHLSIAGKVVPGGELGNWFFPRTGTYVLDYEHTCRGESSGGAAYLWDVVPEPKRLVIHEGSVAEPLNTRITETTVHAYRVDAVKGPGVRVESGDGYGAVVEAARKLEPTATQRNFARLCHTRSVLTREVLGSQCGYRFRRNDDYLVINTEPTRLERYAAASTPIDGSGDAWRGADPKLLRFSGTAGQFVRPETSNLDLDSTNSDTAEVALRGPDGYVHPWAISPHAFGEGKRHYRELLWKLPASGSYLFELDGRLVRSEAQASAAVRSVSAVPMQAGVPVELKLGKDTRALAEMPALATSARWRVSVLSASPELAVGWGVFSSAEGESSVPVTAPGAGAFVFDPRGVVAIPGEGAGEGTITVLDSAP